MTGEGAASVVLRVAAPPDLPAVARLLDVANEGLISHVYAERALTGESWIDPVVREMHQGGGELSYRTTVVGEVGGEVAGMLIVNFLPDPWPERDEAALPAHALSFWRLRSRVPGALFLRDMAVEPRHRGARLATAMLDFAVRAGRSMGHDRVAAIVHEGNAKLLTHYERRGMRVEASEPVREHPRLDPASSWLLLACAAPEGFLPVPATPGAPRG